VSGGLDEHSFVWGFTTLVKAIAKITMQNKPPKELLNVFALKAFQTANVSNSREMNKQEYI
jgi:hypothetical protein